MSNLLGLGWPAFMVGCLILLGSGGAGPLGGGQGGRNFLGSSVGLLSEKSLCARSHFSKHSLGVCDDALHATPVLGKSVLFQKVCVSGALSKVVQNPGVIPGGGKLWWTGWLSCSDVCSIDRAYVSCHVNHVNDVGGGISCVHLCRCVRSQVP